MNQPTNPGGRPAIGPTVPPFAVPAELLASIDADVTRRQTSRAQWLREAAAANLPYDALTRKQGLNEVLDELDGNLTGRREWALNAECPREERQAQAEMYSTTLHEMRTLIRQLRDALPVLDARSAYRQADETEPQNSLTTAKAWGRAAAAETLDSILDAVTLMLPVDGSSIRDRSELDDPSEDLD